MKKQESYRITQYGKKAARRDYSKVSGTLDLPNLVEIQTDSFSWFAKEGIKEVFQEIYPIVNHGENVRLDFISFEFAEPKYSVGECKEREANYAAPLKAHMKLEILNNATGEITERHEDVFLGEFPLMTETGTFIINGAERVIVSQIVRSPGAYYYYEPLKDKVGNQQDKYNSELIPSRGTWLEFMSAVKKTTAASKASASENNFADSDFQINVSIDRKRKILSSILFKAIGFSFDTEKAEDAYDTTAFRTFLSALGYNTARQDIFGDEREFINHYLLMFTSFFGEYPDMINTLLSDKVRTTREALYDIYNNQRADEIATEEGAKNLMKSKFFDNRRYDLTKAGRYKLGKKLSVVDRMVGNKLAMDIKDTQGNIVLKADTFVDREEKAILLNVLNKGLYMQAFPFNPYFSFPEAVKVNTVDRDALVGRILAVSVDLNDIVLEKGMVITEEDAVALGSVVETVQVYEGLIARKLTLNKANFNSVMSYGQRLFVIGRILVGGKDVMNHEEVLVPAFEPSKDRMVLSIEKERDLKIALGDEMGECWLVGTAVQQVYVKAKETEDIIKIIGTDPLLIKKTVTMSDMIASYDYLLNLHTGVGETDDIDQLGNRRIRTVGELIQNQFRIGLSRMERVVKERMSINADLGGLTPKSLTNIRPLTAAIKEFFSSSQLSQFMDQTNPWLN